MSYEYPMGASMDVNKHPDNKVKTHCPKCESNEETYYVPHDDSGRDWRLPDPIYCWKCEFMFPDH